MQKTISQSVSQSIPWQEYSLARISIAGNKLDGVIAALPKLMLETFLIRMQKPIQYKPSKLTGTAASRVRIRFFRRGPDPVFPKGSVFGFYKEFGSGSGFPKSPDPDAGFQKGRIWILFFGRVCSEFSKWSEPDLLKDRIRVF